MGEDEALETGDERTKLKWRGTNGAGLIGRDESREQEVTSIDKISSKDFKRLTVK